MIWKNCSAHEAVEFQTGWSMHHHQSCTKLLQSIFYKFVERHLRKADILQMTTSVNSVNWKFMPPPPPYPPHHFPSKGENSLFYWEPPSLGWSPVSAATGPRSSLKFASGTFRNVARELFSIVAWSVKPEGVISEQQGVASAWEAQKAAWVAPGKAAKI